MSNLEKLHKELKKTYLEAQKSLDKQRNYHHLISRHQLECSCSEWPPKIIEGECQRVDEMKLIEGKE